MTYELKQPSPVPTWHKYTDPLRNHIGSQSENSSIRFEDTPDKRACYFGGYQQFKLTDSTVVPYTKQAKYTNVSCILKKLGIMGKTVSDVGSNNGVVAYIAKTLGALHSFALDHDSECLANISAANKHLSITNVYPIYFDFGNIDYNIQTDIVVAMALVHWVYSCTANYNCLGKIIQRLCCMCKEYLIVEWVSPDDPAIMQFRHIDFNPDIPKEPYTIENFEKAISANNCTIVEILPTETPTRTIYVLSYAL